MERIIVPMPTKPEVDTLCISQQRASWVEFDPS